MQNSHCLLDLVELNDLWSKKICQPRWLFDLVPHSSLDDLVLFWLSKLIKAGKARRGDFWRGCVNLYLLGSHQSSLCKIIGNHHENSRWIGLRNLKMSTTSPTRHTLVSILFFISLSYISNITWTMKHLQCLYTAVCTQVFVPSIDQTVGFLYLEKKPNSSENPLGRLALGLQCESPNVGGTWKLVWKHWLNQTLWSQAPDPLF